MMQIFQVPEGKGAVLGSEQSQLFLEPVNGDVRW